MALHRVWSEDALQAQFDAIADLFIPDSMWGAWVFDVRRTVTTGMLWWQKTATRIDTVEEKRREIPYKRLTRELILSLPPEMTHMSPDFTGWINCMRLYVHWSDTEPIVSIPFKGNSNIVTPGCVIDIAPETRIDMGGR